MNCPLCHQPYETAPLRCAAGGGEPYDMDPDGDLKTMKAALEKPSPERRRRKQASNEALYSVASRRTTGGGCGEYRQQFERFEDAARECDRLNRRDEFVALVRDAAGVVVRDHTAAAVWQ